MNNGNYYWKTIRPHVETLKLFYVHILCTMSNRDVSSFGLFYRYYIILGMHLEIVRKTHTHAYTNTPALKYRVERITN